MKRIVLLIPLFLFSSVGDKEQYIDYVSKIVNYSFKLDKFNVIKPPFYSPPVLKSNKKFTDIKKEIKKPKVIIKHPKKTIIIKRVKIELLSIFSNRAYIKVEKYINNNLVKTYKKWVTLNSEVDGCKLFKLDLNNAYFRCNNRVIHKSLVTKKLLIKDK